MGSLVVSSVSLGITVAQNETLIINETMMPGTYIMPVQEGVIVDDDLFFLSQY